jgi:hypothetical protein
MVMINTSSTTSLIKIAKERDNTLFEESKSNILGGIWIHPRIENPGRPFL